MPNAHKYLAIWLKYLPTILEKIEKANGKGQTQTIQLSRDEFEEVGNRISSGYTFRMDITDAYVPIKAGSSVARDLKYVLDRSG